MPEPVGRARGEPGLVEPGDGQHVAERVAYLRLAGAVHAAAPARGADGHHHAADGSLLADLELADAACGREVVVAERVVAEQVVGGRDPERLVASELVVADPESGVLERCLCGRRGRRLRPRLRPRTDGPLASGVPQAVPGAGAPAGATVASPVRRAISVFSHVVRAAGESSR